MLPPPQVLTALEYLQVAIFFGMAGFFMYMHVPIKNWRQISYMREAIEKLPPWRRRIPLLYPRIACAVMLLGSAGFAVIAAYLAYIGSTTPDLPPATPSNVADTVAYLVLIGLGQAFVVAASFLQLWRGKRRLTSVAQEQAAVAATVAHAGNSSADTGPTTHQP